MYIFRSYAWKKVKQTCLPLHVQESLEKRSINKRQKGGKPKINQIQAIESGMEHKSEENQNVDQVHENQIIFVEPLQIQ